MEASTNKRLRKSILMLAVITALTGCGAHEAGSQKTEPPVPASSIQEPAPEAAASANDDGNPQDDSTVLINSLGDFYKTGHKLAIQKRGENTVYEASEPLANAIMDIMGKAEFSDLGAGDPDYFDYRLKFTGARDILLTLKDNSFHFEGENRRYTFWGDSRAFWDSLVADGSGRTIGVKESKIKAMVKAYQEDIDGNGKEEAIQLSYERGWGPEPKGDLNLSINGNQITAVKDMDWFTWPYRTIGEMPELWFQQEKNGKEKAVLLIYSWATNGVGSTGAVHAFQYINGKIGSIEVKEPERVIRYKGNGRVGISFPSLKRSQEVKADTEFLKQTLDANGTLKQLFEGKEAFYPHPLWYLVKDYNGDGGKDLCSVSALFFAGRGRMGIGREYAYYEYSDRKLKPVHAYVLSFYDEDEKRKYLMECLFDRIHLKGYLTFGDQGITDEDFLLGYDYTVDEIKNAVKSLEADKIVKLKDGRIYINY